MHVATWCRALVVAAVCLVGTTASAGEVKVGFEPLDTDGSGKLTSEGQSAAVTTLEAQPDGESWMLHLWAKIDNGAQGPLYIEVGRVRDGKRFIAKREEIADYGADKYVSADVEIDFSDGFRPGETIQIAFVQNIGGNDAIKAKTDLVLAESSAPPPADDPAPADDEDDELDGDDEDEGEAPAADAPTPEPGPAPAVEPGDKKGCSIGGSTPAPGWLVLVALAAVPRRRRRD